MAGPIIQEQKIVEKATLQRVMDKAKDIRGEVNRFFGLKIVGGCADCSGGDCKSCKGTPSISLWESSTKMDSDRLEVQAPPVQCQENRQTTDEIYTVPTLIVPLNDIQIPHIAPSNEGPSTNTKTLGASVNADIAYLSMKAKIDELKQKIASDSTQIPIDNNTRYGSLTTDDVRIIKLQNERVDTSLRIETTVSTNTDKKDPLPCKDSINTEVNTQITQPNFVRGEEKQPTIAKQDKQYVIGRYTYMDILTTPWLRKLYGHMIGLGMEIETSQNQSSVVAVRIDSSQKPEKGGVTKVPETVTEKNDEREGTKTQVKNTKKKATRERLITNVSRDTLVVKLTDSMPVVESKPNRLETSTASRQTSLHADLSAIKYEIKSIKMALRKKPDLEAISDAKTKLRKIEEEVHSAEQELKKLERLGEKNKKLELEKSRIQKLRKEVRMLKKEINIAELKLETDHILARTEKRVHDFIIELKMLRLANLKMLRSMKRSELSKLLALLKNKKIIRFLMLGNSKSRRAKTAWRINRIINIIKGIL